jgi:hypothetical protein
LASSNSAEIIDAEEKSTQAHYAPQSLTGATISISGINTIGAGVHFYDDDIEDDANLDLDADYELPALRSPTSPNSGADTSGASIQVYSDDIEDDANLDLNAVYELPALRRATSPNSGADAIGARIQLCSDNFDVETILNPNKVYELPAFLRASSPNSGANPISTGIQLQFHDDDSSSDAELNLDVQYEDLTSEPASHNTLRNRSSLIESPYHLLYRTEVASSQHPLQDATSSAVSWESSPPSPKCPRRVSLAMEQEKNSTLRPPTPHGDFDASSRLGKRKSSRSIREPGDADEPAAPKRQRAEPIDKDIPWKDTARAPAGVDRQMNNKQQATRRKDTNDIENQEPEAFAAIFTLLTKDQLKVRNLVLNEKKNVFFTGAAGTGKSVLMKLMIARLRGTYKENPEKLAVTASTGLAACHIGGITLHSWGGVGLGKDDVNKLVKNIRRNQNAVKRWRETEILIIDEISMIDGALFDKMESIARRLRPKRKNQPFGGIQLVITGDFFQLPPVPDAEGPGTKFAFEACSWPRSVQHTVLLTEVFRQKDPGTPSPLNQLLNVNYYKSSQRC